MFSSNNRELMESLVSGFHPICNVSVNSGSKCHYIQGYLPPYYVFLSLSPLGLIYCPQGHNGMSPSGFCVASQACPVSAIHHSLFQV